MESQYQAFPPELLWHLLFSCVLPLVAAAFCAGAFWSSGQQGKSIISFLLLIAFSVLYESSSLLIKFGPLAALSGLLWYTFFLSAMYSVPFLTIAFLSHYGMKRFFGVKRDGPAAVIAQPIPRTAKLLIGILLGLGVLHYCWIFLFPLFAPE